MVQVQQRVLKFRVNAARLLLAGALGVVVLPHPLAAQKFYPDDPLWRDPRPLPVAKAKSRKIDEYFDFFQNTFFEPDKQLKKEHNPGPSEAVNTLSEVPDSAWFTNRIGSRTLSLAELVRGPGESHPPAQDQPWVVVSAKNEGITPGLVIRDSAGRVYFLKFDPMSNPGMASAADVLGSKLFYDLGYNVPENYIVHFTRRQLAVNQKSRYSDPRGHARSMTAADIDDILRKVPVDGDRKIRGLASLTIPGDILGPFRYYGTRRDDPNDVVDHQKRRDLRGLYVFAAWLNHTDSKSINSLDSLIEENGIQFVRHYLIDFGAILGSDSFEAKSPRAGNVYLFDFKPAAWQFLSLGLDVPAWMRANYPHLPEVGHLEYKTFNPEHWRSNYPNPAFDQRTPGDTYWAAKKVMAFSDRDLSAIVDTAQFTNPRAAEWVTRCLIERRDKIGRAFFQDVLPLDDFAVRGGVLHFDDLAVRYHFRGPQEHSVNWFNFDNHSGSKTPVSNASGFTVPRVAEGRYLAAVIHGPNPRQTVTVYLRQEASGEKVVGIGRTW
ncbi:MAG TPA: hypothetical protein VG675_06965 [Bryobacteraceae bacterium]|nr:hypothetical protein [Bryobacteraceae bacterium]